MYNKSKRGGKAGMFDMERAFLAIPPSASHRNLRNLDDFSGGASHAILPKTKINSQWEAQSPGMVGSNNSRAERAGYKGLYLTSVAGKINTHASYDVLP